MSNNKNKKVWVVSVDMGYGHQRTVHPLIDIAFSSRVVSANSYTGIPEKDQKFWHRMRAIYEFISRFKKTPLIGNFIFSNFLDRFQKILSYYPKRDLSRPTFNLKNIFYLIKKGWGKDLIERLKVNPLPIVSSFFTPAFMAEELHYPNDIYCIVCDADINRAWVAMEPRKSRIKYFTPNTWTRERLKLYGVTPENIFLTGYPLPKENIGKNKEIIKEDLRYRILNLDPQKKYRKIYAPLIKSALGDLPEKSNHPLTILFSIGGAGAQKELCANAIKSLSRHIKEKELRFIIGIGIRKNLKEYFAQSLKDLKLDGWVKIISADTTFKYFELFNQALRETDVLWTKPSELSFFTALGLPIIIAPPIGSQEDFNRDWLLKLGSGIIQKNPNNTKKWLFDLLKHGILAKSAKQGFLRGERMGTNKIKEIIEK